MWQNFNTKRGTQQQNTVGMETLNTLFLQLYIFCTKELSSLRILSSLHYAKKSHIFYDVGITYAIDQKINHLHNDRVANMWRNNVPSVCGRG
jgi:hypothetical protein